MTAPEDRADSSNYSKAQEDLQHAIALDPKMYQAHYLLGNTLCKLNDVDGGIAQYHIAINLQPDQPRTYFQLALALETKQDEAGKQRALEQALTTDSRYAPAQCEMGRILLEQHHPARVCI